MSIYLKSRPSWAFLSLAANGLLLLALTSVLPRQQQCSLQSNLRRSVATTGLSYPMPEILPDLGPRHHLNYRQWVGLLRREAEAVSAHKPENLTVLLGDSLSLWFPPEMLPPEQTWLNQGISGETSAGLLSRLYLLDDTEPQAIFLMIGINDLISGATDETILANQRLIIRYLRRNHPQAKVIVQSILPHSADAVTWEGRDQLLSIPNSRIQQINKRLEELAQSQGVIYLDLYPFFANAQGNLNNELSTDGLHLNTNGYLVWNNVLKVHNQLVLEGGLGR